MNAPFPLRRAAAAAALALSAVACNSRNGDLPPAPEPTPGAKTVSLLRDNGIRCVTHPCFNVDVLAPDDVVLETVSDVDLTALELGEEERGALLQRLVGDGLRATGTIVTVPDAGPAGDGRAFRVSRIAL